MTSQEENHKKSIKNLTNSPKWPGLIKDKRRALGETQAEFGARFNVTDAAVSYWESGTYDPPAEVIWWLVNEVAPHAGQSAS